MKALRYLLIAILFIGLNSCDNDEDDKLIKNSQRIKQVIFESDYSTTKEEFFYENEKLVLVKTFEEKEESVWEELSIMEFEYSPNRIHTRYSEKVDDSYVLISTIESKTYKGIILEETLKSLDYSIDKSWKCKYNYSDAKLINWERIRDNENTGVYTNFEKGEYIYKGNKLTEYKYSMGIEEGTWSPLFKYEFTNTDKGFSDYVCYSYSIENELFKFFLCDYTYNNKLIYESTFSLWQEANDSWMYFMNRLYNYNSDGYLIESISKEMANTYYEYEEGHGNIEYLIYPEIMVLEEPHYKSSNVKETYTPFYKRYNNKHFRN